MKIDIASISKDDFVIREFEKYNEKFYLVFPQHMGCKWTKDNMIFRSSIWNSDGELVSASFKKFFNWSEQPNLSPVPCEIKNCQIMEKIDGCCSENIKLNVYKEGTKTIKDICENDFKGKLIECFDFEKNKKTFEEIIAVSIKENINNWMELILENNDVLILTEEHLVYSNSIKNYKKAIDLEIGEDFIFAEDFNDKKDDK